MEALYTIISAIGGYKLWDLLTNPTSKIQNKFPIIKFKRVQFFPSIKIFVKGRTIHFHHWFSFSILLCFSVFVSGGILSLWVTKGVLVGAVIQGLAIRSPNARKIVYKQLS